MSSMNSLLANFNIQREVDNEWIQYDNNHHSQCFSLQSVESLDNVLSEELDTERLNNKPTFMSLFESKEAFTHAIQEQKKCTHENCHMRSLNTDEIFQLMCELEKLPRIEKKRTIMFQLLSIISTEGLVKLPSSKNIQQEEGKSNKRKRVSLPKSRKRKKQQNENEAEEQTLLPSITPNSSPPIAPPSTEVTSTSTSNHHHHNHDNELLLFVDHQSQSLHDMIDLSNNSNNNNNNNDHIVRNREIGCFENRERARIEIKSMIEDNDQHIQRSSNIENEFNNSSNRDGSDDNNINTMMKLSKERFHFGVTSICYECFKFIFSIGDMTMIDLYDKAKQKRGFEELNEVTQTKSDIKSLWKNTFTSFVVNYAEQHGLKHPNYRKLKTKAKTTSKMTEKDAQQHNQDHLIFLPAGITKRDIILLYLNFISGANEFPALPKYRYLLQLWNDYLPFIKSFHPRSDFCTNCAYYRRMYDSEAVIALSHHLHRVQLQKNCFNKWKAASSPLLLTSQNISSHPHYLHHERSHHHHNHYHNNNNNNISDSEIGDHSDFNYPSLDKNISLQQISHNLYNNQPQSDDRNTSSTDDSSADGCGDDDDDVRGPPRSRSTSIETDLHIAFDFAENIAIPNIKLESSTQSAYSLYFKDRFKVAIFILSIVSTSQSFGFIVPEGVWSKNTSKRHLIPSILMKFYSLYLSSLHLRSLTFTYDSSGSNDLENQSLLSFFHFFKIKNRVQQLNIIHHIPGHSKTLCHGKVNALKSHLSHLDLLTYSDLLNACKAFKTIQIVEMEDDHDWRDYFSLTSQLFRSSPSSEFHYCVKIESNFEVLKKEIESTDGDHHYNQDWTSVPHAILDAPHLNPHHGINSGSSGGSVEGSEIGGGSVRNEHWISYLCSEVPKLLSLPKLTLDRVIYLWESVCLQYSLSASELTDWELLLRKRGDCGDFKFLVSPSPFQFDGKRITTSSTLSQK